LKLKLQQGKIGLAFQPYSIGNNQILKRNAAYDKKQLKYLQSISSGVTVQGTSIRPASPKK
jgi:hypothetical protein